MAGYSGTPLPRKLGLKEGSRVVLLDAPAGFSLGELPAGVKPRTRAGVRTADVAVLFLRRRADLARRFDAAARTVDEGGRLWLAWPKKTSSLAGDLGQADVRQHGMDAGWVDFKVAAIDADWSGLAFARREAKAPRKR
ncbi:MAG: DUF3052 domain-containing protein [Gemmatimonadetes bacterium]|nr:DUF3052 domain-containing protein [Gemmatimonadota bacterium]